MGIECSPRVYMFSFQRSYVKCIYWLLTLKENLKIKVNICSSKYLQYVIFLSSVIVKFTIHKNILFENNL